MKISEPLGPLLANLAKLGGQPESLYKLFERRHSLVHEIRNAQIGHYLLRDRWTFDEAIAHRVMIAMVITEVERCISDFAPDDFPNKLDHDGFLIDRKTLLKKQLGEMEVRIAGVVDAEGIEQLTNARISFEQDMEVQIEFAKAA